MMEGAGSLDVAIFSKGSDMRPVDQLIEKQQSKLRQTVLDKQKGESISSWSDSEEVNEVDHLQSMNDSQLMAMLGITDLYGNSVMSSFFQREDVCSVCGTIHSRPDLLDIYYSCRACRAVLREPKLLRERYKNIPQKTPIEIIYATYGYADDERTAVDVTAKCIEKLKESTAKDRIAFRSQMRFDEFFLGTKSHRDKPSKPGRGKSKEMDSFHYQLRMRYRIGQAFGTLILNFTTQHTIERPFLLIIPSDLTSPDSFKPRNLRLVSANFGHPRGMDSTGRMCYDVVEIVQNLVDQLGGSFLRIPSSTLLTPIFGDPCPGYMKELRIQYEICGVKGSVTVFEVRGFLRKKLIIQSSPTIKPLIFAVSATYGLTPTGRKQRLEAISLQLSKIQMAEHAKRQGSVLTGAEVVLLKSKAALLEERSALSMAPISFLDVREKMQLLCDQAKDCGTHLFLDKESFDPNEYFGQPYGAGSTNKFKLFECHLDCQGHDSERMTETNEMQDTGYMRNFVTVKSARFSIVVEDVTGPDNLTSDSIVPKKGKMRESLDFHTGHSSPVILVTRATYGEIGTAADSRDMSRSIDVTNEVQSKVVGRTLVLDSNEDLNKLFLRDPSPGKRKALRIDYVTRGFTGNLRIRELNDKLVAGIELGYPPQPPPDEEDVMVN